jgi:Ca2+-transporting ATPase
MLGWGLTWAAVELNMLQRLLDTVSLTGPQWTLVIGLSLVAPVLVGIDKALKVRRLDLERSADPVAALDTPSRV